jgi:Secretion system C-terminal sorting domain
MSAFYIPKPCHENWNKMTPEEKGRHCAVCSTVVVDFTKKTPAEVAEVVANAAGTVCGHFNINQLDAKAQTKVFRNPLNIFNKNWKYFAMSVFGLFFLNKKSTAQDTMGKIKMRGMVAPTHNTNTQTSTITGIVSTNDGIRLGAATVIISSNGKELANLVTDADGKYMVKIEPGNIVNKKVSVVVHHYNYETKSILDLSISKHVTTLNIKMESEMILMGIVEEVKIPEEIKPDTIKPVEPVKKDSLVLEERDIEKFSILSQDSTAALLVENTCTTNEPVQKDSEKPINNLVVRPEDVVASIYPNPAGTYATVYCNSSKNYKIELFSLSGALQQTHSFSGDRLKLDVSKLERGTYFVRVNDETGTLNTLKLIKN